MGKKGKKTQKWLNNGFQIRANWIWERWVLSNSLLSINCILARGSISRLQTIFKGLELF